MEMKKIRLRLTGTTPLMPHNPRMSNPLDLFAKALKKISGKKNKTDADHEEMGRLEFLGSLYQNGDGEIVVPGNWIEGMLREAAKKSKRGKVFQQFMFCDGTFPLEFDGSHDPDEMWEDGRFTDVRSVRVGQSRVQRTRPIIHNWAATVEVQYVSGSELDREELIAAAKLAEITSAVGDNRPRFGRFKVEILGD